MDDDPDEDFSGWSGQCWGCLIPFTGGLGRYGTANTVRALLNESQCIERGAVILMMEAVATGLDSWASSHSSPPPAPLPSSCLVRFSVKLEFVSRSLLQDAVVRHCIPTIVFGRDTIFFALPDRADEKW